MKFGKKLVSVFLLAAMVTSIFGVSCFAKTTRDYDIYTLSSKNAVSTKVDYFDVGSKKTCYIYAHYHGYGVVPTTVWSEGVKDELALLKNACYFDYWVADKNNKWVAGGTVRLGDKIKTPLKGKRIYITTRIEPYKKDFVKKNGVIYAKSNTAKMAKDIKYYIKY